MSLMFNGIITEYELPEEEIINLINFGPVPEFEITEEEINHVLDVHSEYPQGTH